MRVNHAKSQIRARIEHVSGAQQNAPGGRIVRTIGIERARAKIGLQNLAYNIRRLPFDGSGSASAISAGLMALGGWWRRRNAKRIGWAIYAVGFVIWVFGYLNAGHAPVFD